jgi:DNA primase
MIDEKALSELQSRVKIEEIIGSFVNVQKKGTRLWACCPFHNENTPSFSISPERGIYKCFGCGVSGDSISFLQQLEGFSFVDAVKYLASRYNVTIEEKFYLNQGERDSFEKIYILLAIAKDFYKNLLFNAEEGKSLGLSYFQSRSISTDAIRKFELGYSLNIWDALYKECQGNGYSNEILKQSGLFIDKGDSAYDRFRGRVVFPIHNRAGKVTGFGARIIDKNSDQPKYINSPETTFFQKRSSLYGIFQAKSEIRKSDSCYLVEGYTDVLALYDCGIKNVIGSMGTALTIEQINIIKRYTNNITVLFDGDLAGIKASLRGIDLLLEQDMYVKVVPLSESEDPHSLSSKMTHDAFHDYLVSHEQDFLEFKAKFLLTKAGNDTALRVEAIQDIIKTLATVKDVVKRLLLTKKCSKIIAIEEHILLEEQDKIILGRRLDSKTYVQKRNKEPRNTVSADDHRARLLESYEREIIRILLNYGSMEVEEGVPIYRYLVSELEDVSFSRSPYGQIWNEFISYLNNGIVPEANLFIHSSDEQIRMAAIDIISPKHDLSLNWNVKHNIPIPNEISDLDLSVYKNILRLKLSILGKLIANNLKLLEENVTLDQQDDILQKHMTLKEVENLIAQQLGMVVW